MGLNSGKLEIGDHIHDIGSLEYLVNSLLINHLGSYVALIGRRNLFSKISEYHVSAKILTLQVP